MFDQDERREQFDLDHHGTHVGSAPPVDPESRAKLERAHALLSGTALAEIAIAHTLEPTPLVQEASADELYARRSALSNPPTAEEVAQAKVRFAAIKAQLSKPA
ncbi:MAG TPA: hypothetical protein VFN56_01295 [Candidatus Saccharimonadales bacterium]|nr:hypothetical protein [Candidatus Saccharimonadales bacterium]